MRDLRRAAEANQKPTFPSPEDGEGFPSLLFIYQGTIDDGIAFFDRLWPTARAIADPDGHLYHAFGIERGRSDQLFSAGVVACGIRATLKGNFNGRPQGDPRLLPGLLLVTTDTILWQHTYRHIGDHPDFSTLPALFASFIPTT